jgi:FAD:protein FMN transferase
MYQFQYSNKNPQMAVASVSFQAMHTCLGVIFPALSKEKSKYLSEVIYKLVTHLDQILNRFDVQSELSKINLLAAKYPVKISSELFEILWICNALYDRTKGFFDVCVQSKVLLKKPTKRYFLDRSQKTVSFLHPGVIIDLGGFAKGYAVQSIKSFLRKEKVTDCFINFGNSSICALGTHPFGDSWRIGIQHIFYKEKNVQSFDLCNKSLSVSGNTPRHPKHIICPKTAEVIEGFSMISVCGSSPLLCEVLSTALFAAPDNKKATVLRNFNNYEGLIIDCDPNGDTRLERLTIEHN